jgi:hypothetical protein
MELREMHGRLLSTESAPGQSANYGSVNAAFNKEDTTNLVSHSIH